MDTLTPLRAALAAQYTLEREIGVGGMAVVYLATDVKHGRRVAVKVLNPELAAVIGPERFLAEIRITANLQHPNLLPLFDSGEVNGLLYYVMPFIAGESLRARLDRERQLPVDDAIHIATAVASALDYAHRHDVVHRDLKPENILLHDGEPVVADFGIALAVSNAGGNRLTQTGLSLGTPHYMSPEQATGERTVDRRTDVYALGAVLYELLTGEPPFSGATTQAIIARVLTESPRAVRATRDTVPAHVDAAIMRALAKLSADRWPSAQAFAAALNASPSPTRESLIAPVAAPSVATRVRGNAIGLGAALVVGAAAALAAMRPWRQTESPGFAFALALPDSAAVTTGKGGTGGDVSISRDGKVIAYVAGPASGGDVNHGIWIRRLDDLTATPVRGTEEGYVPRLSPNAKQLLFARGNGLSVVPITGGSPIEVVPAGSSYDWIDDESIIYSNNYEMMIGVARGPELWVSSVRNAKPRRLVARNTSEGLFGIGFPSVLPRGREALVTIWKGNGDDPQLELAVVSLKDGTLSPLGIAGSNPRYSQGQLLFVRGDALYAAPFSIGSRRVTGEAVQIAPRVVTKISGWADYDVADNGTVTYVAGSETRRRLMLVDRDGRSTPIGSETRRFNFPRVSPDGQRIAVEIGTGSGFDIWTYDQSSRTLSPFTTDRRSIRPSDWTDDGKRLVYIAIKADSAHWGRWDIVISGQTPREAARDLVIGDAAVAAARGSSFAFWSRDGIKVAPLDTPANTKLLVPASERPGIMRFSPDGRYLAYESALTGVIEVFVQQATGDGSRVQISSGGGEEPLWSPDGTEVVYRGGGSFIAARVTRDPFRVVRRDTLFKDTYIRGAVTGNYDIMPNGRQFVTIKAENPDVYPTVLVNRLRARK